MSQVINFYMNLLVERSKESRLPSVNAFNTFFYPKLLKSGYAAVRRWTKKMDIFSKDILLVPVHLGVHWCLAVSLRGHNSVHNRLAADIAVFELSISVSQVVDFRKKSIMYYDSMGGKNNEACKLLL